MEQRHSIKIAVLDKKIAETKTGLLRSGLSCIGFLTLGGIITGITYSIAKPGGTYVATTGLFLVGVISGIVAIWRFIQLLFYLTKSGLHPRSMRPPAHTALNNNRTWKDLD